MLEKIGRFNLVTGIISNVLSSTQVPYDLEKYGIAGYFNPVITSADFGKVKPHPSIFIHAAKCAGVSPSECVHIGNSPMKDIMGAKAAGFAATVQIEYSLNKKIDNRSSVVPDYYIKDMSDLPVVVEEILSLQLTP